MTINARISTPSYILLRLEVLIASPLKISPECTVYVQTGVFQKLKRKQDQLEETIHLISASSLRYVLMNCYSFHVLETRTM